MTIPYAPPILVPTGYQCLRASCGPLPVDQPDYFLTASPAATTPMDAASYTRTGAAAGTVAAGAKSVTITNLAGAVVATVDGTALDAGKTVSWTAADGHRLDAIAYTPGVGGDLAITVVR